MLLGESTNTDEKPKFSSACEHLNFPLASPPAKSQLETFVSKNVIQQLLFTAHPSLPYQTPKFYCKGYE